MNRRGFTLIEVMLMVIIGIILASVAMPSAHTLDDQRVAAAARVLAADIDFARARAMATSSHHRMLFETANERYSVESPPGTTLIEPLSRKTWVRNLGADSLDLLSVNFGGQSALIFDAAGRPSASGTVVLKKRSFEAVVAVAAVTGEVTLTLP